MSITIDPVRQTSWEHFCSRIRKCTRKQRLTVIALLDEAVEDEFISQLTADELLREWDVLRFPEQMPKPLVKHVKQMFERGTAHLVHKAAPEGSNGAEPEES